MSTSSNTVFPDPRADAAMPQTGILRTRNDGASCPWQNSLGQISVAGFPPSS
jgi:hypothetical protein